MTHILVAEDNPVDAMLARQLLEDAGFEVQVTADGRAACEALRRGEIDLVLTDLHLPEVSGLELVELIRRDYPAVPVILMTQYGSEEVAVEALHKGASSYVPKRNLARDIVSTIDEVLAVSSSRRHMQLLRRCLAQTEYHFVLENDPDLTVPLIGQLQQNLIRMQLCDQLALIRVGVALREALVNAIHHGNLEVSSQLRERDDKVYFNLVEERRRQSPYRDRRVHVTSRESTTEAVYVIRDEGNGFDPASVPDPTDPANVDRVTGRGLFLIRTFMDESFHNPAGNQITMIKRRQPPMP